MFHLSRGAARALMLATQGLLQPSPYVATKAAVRDAIRDMGALQIDTIHVVARSPYLVLWSRLGAYPQSWLDDLLAEGALFEYWAHEACFLPIEDYPLYRRLMLDGKIRRWTAIEGWVREHRAEAEQMLEYVRANGPVRSSDFVRTDGESGAWWNWKPEKRLLELLHTIGELMIERRHNFQRIYDVRERVLPEWDDAHAPSLDAMQRAQALRAVRALGVAVARWVPDYFRTGGKAAPLLETLADEGLLLRARIEDWPDTAYIHRDHAALAALAAVEQLVPAYTTLLSPFDPLVWDRKRASELWGFDYRIECYTPAPKRRYGYFTLPILHRGALVGRLDPKAHRRKGVFEVKALHLEPGVPLTQALHDDVLAAIQACADWHGTHDLVIRQSDLPL